MSVPEEIRDLFAPVALGAATPEEAAAVEAWAAAHPEARAEMAELRQAVEALALAAPPADPPRALRRQVLGAVRAEPAAAPAPPARRVRPGIRAWPAAAVALGLACLALVGWNVALRGDSATPGTQTLQVASATPGVSGEVAWEPARGAAVLRLSGLPDPGPERAWRLWAIRDGRPESLGSVTAPGQGGSAAWANARALEGVSALALTPERPDHVGGPTSTPGIQVALPA